MTSQKRNGGKLCFFEHSPYEALRPILGSGCGCQKCNSVTPEMLEAQGLDSKGVAIPRV